MENESYYSDMCEEYFEREISFKNRKIRELEEDNEEIIIETRTVLKMLKKAIEENDKRKIDEIFNRYLGKKIRF